MTEVRDLGVIEGREVPGTGSGAPTPPPVPPTPPHAPPGPPTPPGAASGGAPLPALRPGSPLGAARAEAAQALRDIRDAHRRGPKANTRPVPGWVRRLAWVLDDAVAVPGTDGRRVGIDGFLTLIPGIGDAAGLALSMVVVVAGVAAGVSLPTLLRMLVNVGFESVVGLVPVAGAFFDMVYKANERNVRLIEADLADRRGTRRSSLAVLFLLLLTLFVGMVMLLVFSVLGVVVMVWILTRLLG